jgi:hypothetical protein
MKPIEFVYYWFVATVIVYVVYDFGRKSRENKEKTYSASQFLKRLFSDDLGSLEGFRIYFSDHEIVKLVASFFDGYMEGREPRGDKITQQDMSVMNAFFAMAVNYRGQATILDQILLDDYTFHGFDEETDLPCLKSP